MMGEIFSTAPMLLIFPIGVFAIIYKHWKVLETAQFKEKFGFLVEGINV
jgi:hypothetical protein